MRCLTGANLGKISLDTNRPVSPGVTDRRILNECTFNPIPAGQEWRLPLLNSLFEMRNENWCVVFDEERDDILEGDVITEMINHTCML